uniref:Putative restriction endonuclease domain-containing protein n=1 Tax=uncultured bacterium contig00027 TaxID=1181516 RepID=A0A806KMZ8_9BACT|nr:hypothetical protein [uncultured bacterium contig00027]
MADAIEIDNTEEKRKFTYADYLKWEGPERYQLIKGEAYMMASPSVEHQAILRELTIHFGSWLRGKPCQVFSAPLDVRLFPKKDNSDDTVVQPDLLVVCDKSKLAKNSINGAPELVVEILSPSNTHKELFLKFQYYLEAGVKEYWIINPESKHVLVHLFEDGHITSALYKENAAISVSVLPGLVINLGEIW